MSIPSELRSFLIETRALGRDADGREILVGLTAAETTEYLGLQRDALSAVDRDRFLELADKHEAVRLQVIGAEAAARQDPVRH